MNWEGVIATQYWRELGRVARDCRRIAEDAGFTYEEIAEASGVGAQTVSRFFRGKTAFPSFRTVWCVSAALGLRVEISERGRKLPVAQVIEISEVMRRKTA
jgi:transcriptional regulator with XRE-family HTH domain